jgi:hypothetical protein
MEEPTSSKQEIISSFSVLHSEIFDECRISGKADCDKAPQVHNSLRLSYPDDSWPHGFFFHYSAMQNERISTESCSSGGSNV